MQIKLEAECSIRGRLLLLDCHILLNLKQNLLLSTVDVTDLKLNIGIADK